MRGMSQRSAVGRRPQPRQSVSTVLELRPPNRRGFSTKGPGYESDPLAGASGTGPNSINDRGQVIGEYYNGTAVVGFIGTPTHVDHKQSGNLDPGQSFQSLALITQYAASFHNEHEGVEQMTSSPDKTGPAGEPGVLVQPSPSRVIAPRRDKAA